MSQRGTVTVFAYDVRRDKVRAKVADMLERVAVRVQGSVFEARLSDAKADAVFRAVSAVLEDGDSLRMYAVTEPGLRKSRVAGGAPLPEDGDFWLL